MKIFDHMFNYSLSYYFLKTEFVMNLGMNKGGGGEVCTLIGNKIQYQILPWHFGLVFIVTNLILFVNSHI